MVYTVGNEQDYHFKVLFIILKLGYNGLIIFFILVMEWLFPDGKMKSRRKCY